MGKKRAALGLGGCWRGGEEEREQLQQDWWMCVGVQAEAEAGQLSNMDSKELLLLLLLLLETGPVDEGFDATVVCNG